MSIETPMPKFPQAEESAICVDARFIGVKQIPSEKYDLTKLCVDARFIGVKPSL